MMPERTIWIAAGLLGLIVAVALAVLTSYVARPPAALTSEPVSAGRQLAPARDTSTATPSARARRPAKRARTTPASAPPPAPPSPAEAPPAGGDDLVSGAPSSSFDDRSGSGSGSDDDSGRGRGRGRGGDGVRGGDD